MPRKKLYERKVSLNSHRVKLYDITDAYVRKQTELTGQSPTAVIRELCESARLVKQTDEQFRSGTTKIYQAVTNKLFKTNIADIRTEFKEMKVKFQELELNIRFDNEEVFKVMRAFFAENQILVRLIYKLLEDNEIDINVDEERQTKRKNYETNYNTRKDAFFAKYERLLMEKLVNDAQKSGVEDAAETAASEDGDEDGDEDAGEDSERIQAGSESVN